MISSPLSQLQEIEKATKEYCELHPHKTHAQLLLSKSYLSHALFFCRDEKNNYLSFTDGVMGDIEKFVTDNPSETVLVAPGYEDGDKNVYSEHMMNWFNSIKDKKTADGSKNLYYYDTAIPKLGDVRGRIVIIRRKCFAYGKDEWKSACENIGIHIQRMDSGETNDENFFIENQYDLNPEPKVEAVEKYFQACNKEKYEFTPDGAKESKNKIRRFIKLKRKRI